MPGDPGWRASASRRAQASAIPVIVTPLVSAFAATWSWRIDGQHHLDALHAARQPYVLAVWHGRILPGIGWLRHRGMVALASENFDGEWIARVLERFGFTMVRGSSSRGGVRALVRLSAAMREGRSTVITVDGPRGPAHHAQAGAAWVAHHARAPIVPFHIEANRHWTLSSWDAGQVPKPFSRVNVCVGAPLWVTGGGEAAIETGRVALEAALGRCAERAGAMTRE